MSTRKRPSPSSDDEYGPNQRQKTTKTARTTRGATRKQKTAEELLSEPKNTIFDPKTDLLTLLSKPEARKAIEELRPDLVEHHRRLLNDTGLARRCIANFQRDGRSGFYDPEWQSQAREAFERHRNGDFDEYLKWRLYQDWPELEELDKSREKAAAEAHAAKMAEAEKEEQEEKHQEQQQAQMQPEVPAADGASNAAKEQEELGVEAPVEAQVEAEDSTAAITQNHETIQTPIDVPAPMEDSKPAEVQEGDREHSAAKVQEQDHEQPAVKLPEQDQAQPAIEVQTPNEAQEPPQALESNQQNDFQASKESSERSPTTPPREHSPDVQCITGSQEPHSSSPGPVIDDLPKTLPPTSDVQLSTLAETTLVS